MEALVYSSGGAGSGAWSAAADCAAADTGAAGTGAAGTGAKASSAADEGAGAPLIPTSLLVEAACLRLPRLGAWDVEATVARASTRSARLSLSSHGLDLAPETCGCVALFLKSSAEKCCDDIRSHNRFFLSKRIERACNKERISGGGWG